MDQVTRIILEVDDKGTATIKKFGQEMGHVQKQTKKSDQALKSMKSGMVALAAVTGTAIAAGMAFKKAYDFAEAGAGALRLEESSRRLADTHGQSMSAMLASADAALGGTVNKMELMDAANTSLMLNVSQTPAQFALLAKSAVALGRAMGRTAAESIRDVNTGIGRNSKLILDNLGIVDTGGQAYIKYAEKIGKAVDQLSEADKKQALVNLTIEAAAPLLNENNELTVDAAAGFEAMAASADNVKTSLQKIAAVGISGELSWIVDLLKESAKGWELTSWAVANNVNMFELSAEGMANLTTAFEQGRDQTGYYNDELGAMDGWLKKLDRQVAVPEINVEGSTPGGGDDPLTWAERLKGIIDGIAGRHTTYMDI